MKSSEIVTLQLLKFKELHQNSNASLVDAVLSQNPEVKESLRNICALISPELFNQVEEAASMLDISKRLIVEMALIDFMEKVKGLVEEVNPFEGA
jgi:hypothetical protein